MWSFIKSEQQQLANNKPRVTSTSHIIRPTALLQLLLFAYGNYFPGHSLTISKHGWAFRSHSVHPLRVLLISFALHAMTRPFVRSSIRPSILYTIWVSSSSETDCESMSWRIIFIFTMTLWKLIGAPAHSLLSFPRLFYRLISLAISSRDLADNRQRAAIMQRCKWRRKGDFKSPPINAN